MLVSLRLNNGKTNSNTMPESMYNHLYLISEGKDRVIEWKVNI